MDLRTMTHTEAAAYLNVSGKTLQMWRQMGKVRAKKHGARWIAPGKTGRERVVPVPAWLAERLQATRERRGVKRGGIRTRSSWGPGGQDIGWIADG